MQDSANAGNASQHVESLDSHVGAYQFRETDSRGANQDPVGEVLGRAGRSGGMSPLDQLEMVAATRGACLQRIAARVVRNPHDAEDVVQDALVLARKNISQFRGDAHIGTWVGSIVRNCALMRLRRRDPLSSRVEEEIETALLEALPTKALDPEQTLILQLVSARAASAIASLSLRHRETFELRLEGFSIKQIAERVQSPVGTVKARLSRARDQIIQHCKGWS